MASYLNQVSDESRLGDRALYIKSFFYFSPLFDNALEALPCMYCCLRVNLFVVVYFLLLIVCVTNS
jgi:hypothetical protein